MTIERTLFFWSEEHARAYRLSQQQIDGRYLTLAQSAYSTKIAQSALFGFGDEFGSGTFW
jgi:hypothetical protein